MDKATGLTDVKLEKVAAQKGVRAVDHLMGDSPRVGPAKSAEQVALPQGDMNKVLNADELASRVLARLARIERIAKD